MHIASGGSLPLRCALKSFNARLVIDYALHIQYLTEVSTPLTFLLQCKVVSVQLVKQYKFAVPLK